MSEREEQETQVETAAGSGTRPDAEPDVERAIEDATEAVAVQARRLEELDPADLAGEPGETMGLGSLMDVPVRVTVEVGRTQVTLGELVAVRPGSLLELDREAHEAADVLVNGKTVARGEIVTIDGRYGVRITQVA